MHFTFPVFGSKTGLFPWFGLSFHIHFWHEPWIVCLSLHIRKCWDMPSDSNSSYSWSGSSRMIMMSSWCPGAKVGWLSSFSWGIRPWFCVCFSIFIVSCFIRCETFWGSEDASSNCGVGSFSVLSLIVPLRGGCCRSFQSKLSTSKSE